MSKKSAIKSTKKTRVCGPNNHIKDSHVKDSHIKDSLILDNLIKSDYIINHIFR